MASVRVGVRGRHRYQESSYVPTLRPEGKEIENTVVSRAHFNEPLLFMGDRSFEKSLVADGQINRGLTCG